MKTDHYFTLKINGLTLLEADLVSAAVFSAGACGTEEHLPFTQGGRNYEPQLIEHTHTDMSVYFLHAPDAEFIESLKAQFPEAQFKIERSENKDWLSEWKKNFKPFHFAGETWVVPSWCDIPSHAKNVIRMDPGMAFGTGTHETTKLAAGLMADFATGDSLLDVGTGTGILAILAEQKGFKHIVANDIDPEARRVTRENLALNRCHNIQVVDDSLEQISGEYDWVVANIIDGVLIRLQVDLKKRLKPGGSLLMTGILDEREALFLSEFEQENLKLLERRQFGEWVGFLFRNSP